MMKKIQVLLDRKQLSSEEVLQRQNFNEILVKSKMKQSTISFKKIIFYGATGLSLVAMLITLIFFEQTKEQTVQSLKSTARIETTAKPISESQHQVKTSQESKIVQKIDVQNPSQVKVKKIQSNETVAVSDVLIDVEPDFVIPENKGIQSSQLYFPIISGKKEGRLTKADLEQSAKIESEPQIQVCSFEITYIKNRKEVQERVEGSEIPNAILTEIFKSNSQELFFTKIQGIDSNRKKVSIEPLHLMFNKQ